MLRNKFTLAGTGAVLGALLAVPLALVMAAPASAANTCIVLVKPMPFIASGPPGTSVAPASTRLAPVTAMWHAPARALAYSASGSLPATCAIS